MKASKKKTAAATSLAADPADLESAQHHMHASILGDIDSAQPAVVFNAAAGAASLISFAFGQLSIIDEVLHEMEKAEAADNAFSTAMLALVGPAQAALMLACSKVEKGGAA